MRGTSRGSLRRPSNTCLLNFCGSSTFQLRLLLILWAATATATATAVAATATAVAVAATAEEGSGSGIVREAGGTAVAARGVALLVG